MSGDRSLRVGRVAVYCDAGPIGRSPQRGYRGPLRCGVLLLAEDGSTLSVHVQRRTGTIAQGEAWAVQLGVAEALRRGAAQICIYTDCQSTALALQGRAQVRDREADAVVRWVRNRLAALPGSAVRWVPRRKNQAVHQLVQ